MNNTRDAALPAIWPSMCEAQSTPYTTETKKQGSENDLMLNRKQYYNRTAQGFAFCLFVCFKFLFKKNRSGVIFYAAALRFGVYVSSQALYVTQYLEKTKDSV